jgi:hypothetical protein
VDMCSFTVFLFGDERFDYLFVEYTKINRYL